MPTTLEFYWELASLDESTRINAATQLISTLLKFQAEMPATTKMATTEKELDEMCAGDVSYGVKRLIKGLASPRDGARQGYSVALAELLSRIECISVKLVLDLLWKSTEATNSMKGQEQRDMRFGRIFGLMALVQSGIITRQGTTTVEIRKIVMELVAIGAKKSYLREIAFVTLTSMVPMLKQFSARDELIGMFVEVGLDKGAIETPDELLLAMRLRRQYPGYDWHSALPQWQGRHMLSARNGTKVAKILCEQTENPSVTGTWHPQLHRVWEEIFDLYFSPQRADEAQAQTPMEFEQLWERVVENGLFAPGASQSRRFWGFLLLERILPHLSEDTVPSLMSPNIVRAMSDNISAKNKTPLAKVGVRTAEKLSAVCESNTKVGLAVLTHLLSQKSTIRMDGRMSLRSLMANRIVAKLDGAAIVGYVEYLQKLFAAPRRVRTRDGLATGPQAASNAAERTVEKQRAWAVDQMVRVARFGQLPVTDDLAASVLRFLSAHAAFVVKDSAKCNVEELREPAVPLLSGATRDYCALALTNMVGELSRQASSEAGRAIGRARDGTAWATWVLGLILDKRHRGVGRVLHRFEETRPDLEAILKQLREMAAAASKLKDSGDVQRVQALEILQGNLGVAAAFGAEPQAQTEYLEAAAEVGECFERLERQLAGKKAADGEPQPVEVLTDILLSLFTRDSSVLRRLCDQVFVPFAEIMTAPGIEAIVGVLQAKEGAGDGAVETAADALDAMEVDGEEEEEEETEPSQMEGVDEELRQRIQEALGNQAGEVSDSSDEEIFDDEQMTVFDDKLAEIFRHKKEQKNWARELRLSLVNFKLRVLDVTDVFLARQGENPLVLLLVPVLIDLARSTLRDSRSRAVHERAVAILHTRLNKTPVNANPTQVRELHAMVHERARRAGDQRELDVLAGVAAFAARTLLDAGEDGEDVHKEYSAAAADFMSRKASQMHVGFFRTCMDRLRASQLSPMWRVAHGTLEQYARPQRAVNVYRQVQAFALADATAATAARIASDLDAAEVAAFVEQTRSLLLALRAALQETILYAVSEENRNSATGKLLLDAPRLREIIQNALQLVRRLSKIESFAPAIADSLTPDAEWTRAVRELETADKLASPVIKNLCRNLSDLTQKPVSKSKKIKA
ncbi:DNA-directed DNA polymerase [Coemansia brasiliensis]|uniref:DNA-directed DNA polymerase n=1 Tax=Coemansia brasiliensis TaxID=2650707 RepID=A0A9W8M1Q0_9FUNG|nr:DNA-directed DNA polymerase [Coemansia brasiliensis]